MTGTWLRRFGFWLMIVTVSTSTLLQAQWSKLIDPGELSLPHSEYKGIGNCSKCHITAQGVPDDKCLECHREIAAGKTANKGYHAKVREACASCHSEHKGINYDITGLTRLKFDHRDTGWPLTGGHSKIDCLDCHTQKRVHVISGKPTSRPTYLKASPQCVSCHNDIHRARTQKFKQCQNCHTTKTWGPIKAKPQFSHNQDTKYPLIGGHSKATCYSCHTSKTWAPLKFANCSDCHADPHKGSLGPKCADCHTPANWHKVKSVGPKLDGFDHQKTRFPLTGAHIKVTCQQCHGPKIGKMKNFDQCSGCHNNPHGTQFVTTWKKKVCTDCHVTTAWDKLNFDHNRDARYPLVDRHLEVKCQDCHQQKQYRWLQTSPTCASCHKDVHSGQFVPKDCNACHSVKGFAIANFDHNRLSRFPLIGSHGKVACAQCHPGGKYKPIETTCWSCHDDVHKGEFGKECVRCHQPTKFTDIQFDHNRDSRFPLTGQHVKVACQDCHKGNKYKIGLLNCDQCHDDVHKGSFGQACQRCHSTTSFKVDSRFHDFGQFSLSGVHDRVNCLVCHGPQAPIRSGTAQCSSCHKDPHMSSFSQECWQCHNQVAWLPSTFRHNQTGFELSGAHRFVSCNQCHFNRVFGGLPQECSFCHLKDFNPVVPAEHQVSSTCDQCHRTYGWRPARR